MTRAERNKRSTLPVSRNLVAPPRIQNCGATGSTGVVEMHQGNKHGKRSKRASAGSKNLWNQPAELAYSVGVIAHDRRWSK